MHKKMLLIVKERVELLTSGISNQAALNSEKANVMLMVILFLLSKAILPSAGPGLRR